MNYPPWLSKGPLNYQKDEKEWADRREGRKQPNSGRSWHSKADEKDSVLLTDCKETLLNGFRITIKDWVTLKKQARALHRQPCFKIKFVGAEEVEELVVISSDLLVQLLACVEAGGNV